MDNLTTIQCTHRCIYSTRLEEIPVNGFCENISPIPVASLGQNPSNMKVWRVTR